MTPFLKLIIISGFTKVISKDHLAAAAKADLAWDQLLDHLGLKAFGGGFDSIANSRDFKDVEVWLSRSDCNVTTYGDRDYPVQLLNWPAAPAALWYRGRPSWKHFDFMSVVGSRNPSPSSIEWMNWQLGRFLHDLPIGVVSGGARGIDQRAHLLAIQASRPTLALMPVGMMHRYPPAFAVYEEAVIEGGGAVVSPFPPQQMIFKSNFAYRNYVIAALAPVTLIVEARRRSGTMITAQAAGDLGKEVAVVPTSPVNTTGLGNLDLIADGAKMTRDALDLALIWSSVVRAPHGPPSEISDDDVDAPDGDSGRENLVSGQSFG
jgi:DNA processing protein